MPFDAVRELVLRGELGGVLDAYYVTCGNHGILGQMAVHGWPQPSLSSFWSTSASRVRASATPP